MLHVSATGTYREQQAEAGSDAITLQQRSRVCLANTQTLVPAGKLAWHLLCVSPLFHWDILVFFCVFFIFVSAACCNHHQPPRCVLTSDSPSFLLTIYSGTRRRKPTDNPEPLTRTFAFTHALPPEKVRSICGVRFMSENSFVDTLQKTSYLQQWTTNLKHVSRF